MRTLSILVLVVGVLGAGAADAADRKPIISVTGDAVVMVTPDRVVLTVGVSTRDSILATSKKMNDEKCARLLDALGRMDVDMNDVQSDYVKIEPRYEYGTTFLGYDVNKIYVITIRDVERFEEILTSALESGVEYVHGVSFLTSELKSYRDRAREEALRAAREKAEKMSAVLGQKIGRPESIDERASHWFSSYGTRWGTGRAPVLSQTVVQTDTRGGLGGTFEPGKIEVKSTVAVTFALE
jgi:uncharacterized protein YggE